MSDYRRVFVGRAHQVLEGGYRRLDPSKFVAEEETAITGELKGAMREYLRHPEAPAWADNFFVQEEEPVNDGIRKGKSRSRVDIGVECSTPRPGTSFSFEAKRLARGYTVSKYLGTGGLGCILRGDYARDEDEAGMIGYMQDDDGEYWAAQLAKAIRDDAAAYEIADHEGWTLHTFPQGPAHGFVSKHARNAVGRPVVVYHSLLLFRPVISQKS